MKNLMIEFVIGISVRFFKIQLPIQKIAYLCQGYVFIHVHLYD